MDVLEFAHLTYGELVNQFGRDNVLRLSPWDRLSDGEREKWVAALAVIHAQIFPHGPRRPPVGHSREQAREQPPERDSEPAPEQASEQD
jgi:hypothetical protein